MPDTLLHSFNSVRKTINLANDTEIRIKNSSRKLEPFGDIEKWAFELDSDL